MDQEFWDYLDRLLAACPVVIDRPKASAHPRYPQVMYPLDYGYLEGSTTVDGGGVDVWVGALPERALTALVISVDLQKRDAEVKLLLGCDEDDYQSILAFHNANSFRAMLVRRP